MLVGWAVMIGTCVAYLAGMTKGTRKVRQETLTG